MKIPKGMEPMVFSYAYYEIKDFDKVINFFNSAEDKGLFSIDRVGAEKKEMSGAFLRDYPKGHWNPSSNLPGAKQVVGSAEIKDNTLKVEAMTRGRLKQLREILEQVLGGSIEFQKQEFKDVMEMLRKR